MTRHKGMSKKGAVDDADLKEIVDCYFTLRRIMASLNHASPQQYPLMATVTTLKACWADLSGAQVAAGWSYPADFIPSDGLAPNADRSGKPREKTYIERGRRGPNNSTVPAPSPRLEEGGLGAGKSDAADSHQSALAAKSPHYPPMSNARPTRQGPLVPHPAKDSVVIEDPSRDPIVMTAEEADLSAIRMLDAAEEARANEAKGERSE